MNFNKKEFEIFLGAPGQQIGKYEKGLSTPQLAVLLKLEEISGISIYDLCTQEIDRSSVPDKPLKQYKSQPIQVEKVEESRDKMTNEVSLQKKVIKLLEEKVSILTKENLNLKEEIAKLNDENA